MNGGEVLHKRWLSNQFSFVHVRDRNSGNNTHFFIVCSNECAFLTYHLIQNSWQSKTFNLTTRKKLPHILDSRDKDHNHHNHCRDRHPIDIINTNQSNLLYFWKSTSTCAPSYVVFNFCCGARRGHSSMYDSSSSSLSYHEGWMFVREGCTWTGICLSEWDSCQGTDVQ